MKLTRSSIAQLSRQDIDWSSQPTENCHPSIRSTLLPIYPVWTPCHPLPQGERGKGERRPHPCSACSSFKIASPICVVLAALVPSDLMSAVRRPLASTADIAASSLSASAPMSKE